MLMGRRFGRPGLLGLAARTAVVAGTAGAVSGAMQRRSASREQEQEEAAAYEQQQSAYSAQPAPAPPASPAGGGDDVLSRLERLGQLRQQGVLTEAEFEAEKAKILQG